MSDEAPEVIPPAPDAHIVNGQHRISALATTSILLDAGIDATRRSDGIYMVRCTDGGCVMFGEDEDGLPCLRDSARDRGPGGYVMTTYVMLRIDNDNEARDLVEDMQNYPDNPLLTPSQENTVHARIVPGTVTVWKE